MTTIWKFALTVGDDTTVTMPQGAVVLGVKDAGPGLLSLWAVVDPDARTEERLFHVRGTGHPLGEVGAHVATVATASAGMFVWHVFEGAAA